ncbi:MAG TPA: c-type cytochrome [Solirubrobacteraceae bacterium]|nr:c-type cytochrome [Solirubrobacteraceae bacterium]
MRPKLVPVPRRVRAPLALVAGAAALFAVGGCGLDVKEGRGDLVNGKKLFVQKCGACHILQRANARGTTGPNLDEAFKRALKDGFKRDTVRSVTEEQIGEPNLYGSMPANLVTGDDAADVAAYVGFAAARRGEDQGALATAVGGAQKPLAKAQNGTLVLPADPNGQLLFTFKNAEAPAGLLTIRTPNESSVPHNVAIQGGGINEIGPVVTGGVSEIKVTVRPGRYPFLCTVEGHAAAGMKGTLTVR